VAAEVFRGAFCLTRDRCSASGAETGLPEDPLAAGGSGYVQRISAERGGKRRLSILTHRIVVSI
jgi:hypothetical protein